MPHLAVIYGAPLTGKSSLAREVALSFERLRTSGESKTALVSVDALLDESIVVPDGDSAAELEMVLTQARLLVANYLKNRYNVVLEGAFFYERGGRLHRHEQEIDQTIALMRNLARAPLLVRLSVGEEELRRRAAAAGRPEAADAALRIDPLYKRRDGARTLQLATDEAPVAVLASQVVERLEAEAIA